MMKGGKCMKEVKYIITDELGIHARPAGLLVKAVSQYNCDVTIKKGEKEGNAKSIISIMTLGVKKGDEVTFLVDGTDEAEASETLRVFLSDNL
jgi:phosphocarrier protein